MNQTTLLWLLHTLLYDDGAQAAKMEKQKEAVEQRYAKKMDKILTKLSKETDRARVRAVSTRTSPFKVQYKPGYHSLSIRTVG